MTLEEEFENLMAKAFPHFTRNTPPWVDIEQAFYAGCLTVHVEYMQQGPKPNDVRMAHALELHSQLEAFGAKLKKDQDKERQQREGPSYGNN